MGDGLAVLVHGLAGDRESPLERHRADVDVFAVLVAAPRSHPRGVARGGEDEPHRVLVAVLDDEAAVGIDEDAVVFFVVAGQGGLGLFDRLAIGSQKPTRDTERTLAEIGLQEA